MTSDKRSVLLKVFRRRLAEAVAPALVLVTGAMLAGCSGKGGGADASGSTVNFALSSAVASLDPNSGALSGQGNAIVQGQRGSTLLEYGLTADSCSRTMTGEDIQPGWMVAQWSTSADKKAMRFTLKPGIRSQAGNELTSADVQYSIERLLAIDPTGTYIFATLGGFSKSDPVTIIDRYNFVLNVDKPSQASAPVLTFYWLQIHDAIDVKAHATAADPWAKKYLSTHTSDFGPWALESFTPNQWVSYVRNPNYTGPVGNIKKVTFTTIVDSSQRTQLIASGQAQITMDLPPRDLKTLEHNDAVELTSCVSANRDYLGLNANDPILSKPQVRKAISMAIDREAISSAIYLDKYGKPSRSGVSSVFGPSAGTEAFRYDVARARALLREAGYPDGFDLRITISTGTPGPYANTLAIFLHSQLAKIGINVSIAMASSPTAFSAAAAKHQYQAYLWAETPTVANPGLAAKITAACGSSQNYGGYCDPALDALAQQTLAHEPGSSEYQADVEALSAMIDAQLPAIYLQDVSYTVPVAKCAAAIPRSSQVKWASLAAVNITC